MRTDLSDSFGIDFALFAFNYQPDVVIEVCKAGGLGVLGAVRFTPKELSEALDYIEANIGGRPYGVDVVMPAKTEAVAGMEVGEMHAMLEKMIPQEHKDFVESVLDKYNVPKLPEGSEGGRDLLSWSDTEAPEPVSLTLARAAVKSIVNAPRPPRGWVSAAHGRPQHLGSGPDRLDHGARRRPTLFRPRGVRSRGDDGRGWSRRCHRRGCRRGLERSRGSRQTEHGRGRETAVKGSRRTEKRPGVPRLTKPPLAT